MPRLFLLPAGKGKRAVLLAPLVFLASQLLLGAYLDWRLPELRDPLYAFRLRSLRAQVGRSPDSPLVLALGSSRVKYGVRPSAIGALPGPTPPLVYNFGINGAGCIRELLYFRRLLADGARPDWLLIETWPPLWAEDGYLAERRMVVEEDELHWGDLPLLCSCYADDPEVLPWAVSSALPFVGHRTRLLHAVARRLLPRDRAGDLEARRKDSDPLEDTGWFRLDWGPTTPEGRRHALEQALAELRPLLDPLRIDPRSDRALREVLDECRRRGIRAALLLMPEHSVARGWYSPQARTLAHTYLAGLGREYQVPVIDTRGWAPDDHFVDYCHMGERGAGPYSERLGREVLAPLLSGRPLGRDVLLAAEDSRKPE